MNLNNTPDEIILFFTRGEYSKLLVPMNVKEIACVDPRVGIRLKLVSEGEEHLVEKKELEGHHGDTRIKLHVTSLTYEPTNGEETVPVGETGKSDVAAGPGIADGPGLADGPK